MVVESCRKVIKFLSPKRVVTPSKVSRHLVALYIIYCILVYMSHIEILKWKYFQEQASWVCECDDVIVHQVEMEVKKVFQHHYGLEQWAGWLDDLTTHLLQEHIGNPDFARTARQLILKWTFYRSICVVWSEE